MEKYPYKMSTASCGLESAIDNIPGLKEYFMDLGYAVVFKKNRYILSVDLFHRIYKGAIGEVVGKYILLSNGIELNEINNPDHFEWFDFHNNNVYFDFKNWSEDFSVLESDAVRKTISKAKKIGAKKVFVINVFSKNYKKEKKFTIDEIELTTVPYLYDTNTCMVNENIVAEIKLAIEEQ